MKVGDTVRIGRPVYICEISSSHGGEYDVQSCLLGYIRDDDGGSTHL
jgi:hypothetical protein